MAKGAFFFFAAGFSCKYFFLDTDDIVCYFYKSIFRCVGSFKAHQEGFDNHPKKFCSCFSRQISMSEPWQ